MSLWTASSIALATGGKASVDFAVSGVAFDSREVGKGDLFVATTRMPNACARVAIASPMLPRPRMPSVRP